MSGTHTRTCVFGLALVGLVLGATGCVTVRPEARKHLSKPEMTPATDALEDTFNGHIDAARRAGINGHGGGGGGCGCG